MVAFFPVISRSRNNHFVMSGQPGSFSSEYGTIYPVSPHHEMEGKCVVHVHTDLVLHDLCHCQEGSMTEQEMKVNVPFCVLQSEQTATM